MDTMKRFVRRFSNAGIETPRSSLKARHTRSNSESCSPYSDLPHLGEGGSEHTVFYMGYAHIDEPKSGKEIQATIRNVRQSMNIHKAVLFQHRNGTLNVSESSGEKLLVFPLHCVAHCTHDMSRGYSDCLAVTFSSGHYAKQCHVFQAMSSREAADMVQALQKASRLATKSRRSGEIPPPLSFAMPKRRESPKLLHLHLEDEEEIIEFKPISSLYRRESKRPVIRTSGETTSSASSITGSLRSHRGSTSDSAPSLTRLSGHRSAPSPPKTKRRSSKGSKISDFTRKDRVDQVLMAVDKLNENNRHLRMISSNQNPQNIFQDGLYAIHTSNMELLHSYLTSKRVPVNSSDSTGNTLLHYAVALGHVRAVRLLCHHKASLEAKGWNECRPIHRAAVEGSTAILQTLLVHGANVNATDMMRRTPLHMSSGKMERMECVIALLEYGAQITATDVLDLRPFDLNPELKETQNRLITSACEAFTSSSKDGAPLFPPSYTPSSSTTPNSSRPCSINEDHMMSGDLPHPLGRYVYGDPQLNLLLDEVNSRAKALVSQTKILARKAKLKRSVISRSFGNLSELKEAEEDEMLRKERLQQLKFPSEFNLSISPTYYEMENTADEVVMAMNKLIRAGKRTSVDVQGSWAEEDGVHKLEMSLSEPDLHEMIDDDAISSLVPRPLSSQAILQSREQGLGARIRELRTHSITSQSSAGTLVREDGDSVTSEVHQRVSQAFESLEMEFHRSSLQEEAEELEDIVRVSESLRNQLRLSKQLQPDASPLMEKRTREETEAIFDDIIGQMNEACETLRSPTSVQHSSQTSASPEEIAEEQVDLGATGAQMSPEPHPRTLHGPKLSLPFKLHSSHKNNFKNDKRKMSLPDVGVHRIIPRSLSGGDSSSDLVPGSSWTSLDVLCGQPPSHSSTMTRASDVSLSEPVANALKNMVSLSTNKECLPTLISYICLPKCMSRLTTLAESVQSTTEILNNIAALMQNIFESGGSEGKKNALGSGILDLTIKLLHSRDPVPGTCLSLLNSLLVGEDDNDYLRTIIRIPSEPLLTYLEPYESDIDSGIDNQRRDTSFSATTRSSSDYQGQPTTSDDGSRPSSGLGMTPRPSSGGHLEAPPIQGSKFRGASFNSELSEGSSTRSLVSPTLRGVLVTHLEAKRIVLKMLAVSSSHSKMQHELSTMRAVSLLIDCLEDPSQENITNATITLANIAQNMGSHPLFLQGGLPGKLKALLTKGPRPRYHAARALIYLGDLDLGRVSLFEPTGYETDSVILTTDDDGHPYARGATIERCVEFLTGDITHLWGGFTLVMGPQSPTGDLLTPKATKEQILDFFLSTYQSFVHPIVFMRLLLHRLASKDHGNPFDWSVQPDKSTITPTPHSATIPPVHMSVLNVIGRWLEMFPDDFLDHPRLQENTLRLLRRLKLARGPYIPHTHRLKSLLNDIDRPRADSSVPGEERKRVPHHENLYKLCKKMITGGHLPVTGDQAIIMAGLQMHIEELMDPTLKSGSSSSLTRGKRSFSARLKVALPLSYGKPSKPIIKRIKSQILEFSKLSERNSKHQYIERCQAMPGYDCTFFSVRVPSGGRFRKGTGLSKQLLGISDKCIVFLDEKTKELISRHSLQDVLSIKRESDPSSVLLMLRDSSCRCLVETAGVSWEIANVLEQCKDGEGLQLYSQLQDDNVGWSDSLYLLDSITQDDQFRDSASSPSTNENSAERETTPFGPDKTTPSNKDTTPIRTVPPDRQNSTQTQDSLGVSKSHHHTNHSPHATVNGHLTEAYRVFAREDSMATELNEDAFSEDKASFCDCPPDPEIPLEISLQHLTLTNVLKCPVEVARQMTLIAHERLCSITSIELLQKVNLIPKSQSHQGSSLRSLSLSTLGHPETAIEKLAYRFNQVGNWVANSILQYEDMEERVKAVEQFIMIAKHCLDYRNLCTMMAIIVAGLGSAPIRRLHKTWEGVSKQHVDYYKQMDTLLDSRGNYKHYREKLNHTSLPAAPYVGVFLKDLTFICDGNPDYLRGGLINIHKRRQVYKKLEEIHHFQQEHYNFHIVPELRHYMLSYRLVPEDELHSVSHILEPRIRRSHSQSSGRGSSVSTTPNFSFFRALTRSGSTSASNLFRIS